MSKNGHKNKDSDREVAAVFSGVCMQLPVNILIYSFAQSIIWQADALT